MVEFGTVRIHPVMAGHAVCPKSKDVLLRKGLIDLQMALRTNFLIEGSGIAAFMAVITCKWSSIHSQTVGFERKAKLVVWIPARRDAGQGSVRPVMFGVAGATV